MADGRAWAVPESARGGPPSSAPPALTRVTPSPSPSSATSPIPGPTAYRVPPASPHPPPVVLLPSSPLPLSPLASCGLSARGRPHCAGGLTARVYRLPRSSIALRRQLEAAPVSPRLLDSSTRPLVLPRPPGSAATPLRPGCHPSHPSGTIASHTPDSMPNLGEPRLPRPAVPVSSSRQRPRSSVP